MSIILGHICTTLKLFDVNLFLYVNSYFRITMTVALACSICFYLPVYPHITNVFNLLTNGILKYYPMNYQYNCY